MANHRTNAFSQTETAMINYLAPNVPGNRMVAVVGRRVSMRVLVDMESRHEDLPHIDNAHDVV